MNYNTALNVLNLVASLHNKNNPPIQLLFEAVGLAAVAHVLTFCAAVAVNKQETTTIIFRIVSNHNKFYKIARGYNLSFKIFWNVNIHC